MKKILISILISAYLAFGGSALALTISGDIYVGDVDEIYACTYIFPPDDTNETEWIQSVLGEDYYVSGSYSISAENWFQTNENPYAYATALIGEPEYFYIWLATNPNNPPNYNAFLYVNDPSMDWAVIDLSVLAGDPYFYVNPGDQINIGVVSHMRDTGGTHVPEPSMVILLGGGLLGLFFYGRRFRKE